MADTTHNTETGTGAVAGMPATGVPVSWSRRGGAFELFTALRALRAERAARNPGGGDSDTPA